MGNRLRRLLNRLAATAPAIGGSAQRLRLAGAIAAGAVVLVLAGTAGTHLAIRARPVDSTGPGAAGPVATATATTQAPPEAAVRGGASPTNRVQVVNQAAGHLRVDGRIQYNAIPGSTVTPVNVASAFSSCAGCQTLAVALQINVFSRSATAIAPVNVATAVNYRCTGCTTIARAIQYNIGVDDPHAAPDRTRQLVAAMKAALAGAQSAGSLAAAEAQINGVIAQFQDLATSLIDQRHADSDDTTPGATPAPPPSGSAPAASSPAPSSPSPTAPPTVSPSTTPQPSPSPT